VARAKAEIAMRGLVATVTENYYAMVSAIRKYANAQQSQQEPNTSSISPAKQESGRRGGALRLVKAEIQFVQRPARELRNRQLALDKARIGLAVLLFPDFRQDFTVVDDLDNPVPCPASPRFRPWPARKVPISAPPRPPSSSSGGKSNRPAPPCCPPYPPITSSASMPTNSPSTTPKATATLGRWSRPS